MKNTTQPVEASMTIDRWQAGVLRKLIPSLRRNYAAQVRSIEFEPGKLQCRIRISAPVYDGIVSVQDNKAVLTWLR
jgi:hypothetical protein